MTAEEFRKMFDERDRQLLVQCLLPEHDALIDAIRALSPTTGIARNLFCNGFMAESVELIKHALFLYEDGYFDCAFYSLRQSVENMNSMLLLVDDENKLKQWKEKVWFPMDNKVKALLEEHNAAYSEIKEKIPEFFAKYKELQEKANKYIHKQGFDTFYIYRIHEPANESNQRTNIFVELMKHALGMLLVMNIALDPLSLALSDPDVDNHIAFDPMTEPIPVNLFEEFLSSELIEKIKETQHYKTVKDFFMEQEQLNDGTYLVIRWQCYDISLLDDIAKQAHLLSLEQVLMLNILQAGVKASHFYQPDNIIGYSTSYKPRRHISEYRSNQFDEYLGKDNKFNIEWNEMHISVCCAFDSHQIIQHNDVLSDREIEAVKRCVDAVDKLYREHLTEINAFINNL